jgi:hypothetical protein
VHQLNIGGEPTQEQFFQLWERAPESAMYNSGFSAFLHGNLDVAALQAAAHMLCQRQEVSWIYAIVSAVHDQCDHSIYTKC